MNVSFTGDDRTKPVSETIRIDYTTETLVLYVKAYQTGTGRVRYSWDGISPCLRDQVGCEPCENWAEACKDDEVPVCDGVQPQCVHFDQQVEQQSYCKHSTHGYYFF